MAFTLIGSSCPYRAHQSARVRVAVHRLQPFIGAFLSGHLNRQMGKPAIRRCSMPVLYPCRNIHNIPREQLLRPLSPFLIKPLAADANQNLTAAVFGMMDVPVVAAPRFKGHVVDSHLLCGKRGQIALPDKILRESVIRLANGKNHGICMGRFLIVRGCFFFPYFLCHAESRPCFRPTGVKGRMRQDLSDFRSCNAVLFRAFQMVLKRRIRQSLRHQGHDRHQRTVAQGKLAFPAPYLAKQHFIIQLRKLWGKITQRISSRRLFYCHRFFLLQFQSHLPIRNAHIQTRFILL